MEKRVWNCIIIGLVVFLVLILVQNRELFTGTPEPNDMVKLSGLLNQNHGTLVELESDIEKQLSKMRTYIRNNDYLVQKIKKEKENYQNLIKKNKEVSEKILINVINLAKKKGIKNPQKIVEEIINKFNKS